MPGDDSGWHRLYSRAMSVPAAEPPGDGAAGLMRRAVVTHFTVDGERLTMLVPAALMDSLRILAGLLASGTWSRQIADLLTDVYPWAADLPAAAMREFAGDLGRALRKGSEAPDGLEAAIAGWRATAEIYADPELLAVLTEPLADSGPVPDPYAR